jgi:hypothetical protein
VDCIDPAELGGFEEVLQLRLMVVDLERSSAWNAIEAIEHVRSELMLNVRILCFGGDSEARGLARMAGADRDLAIEDLIAQLPEFCRQFGW